MATQRQKKLAKAIVENTIADKPKTSKELLVNVGYAINTAEVKPKEIIEAEGVQSEIKTLADQIPDSLLIEKHLELLGKREKVIIERTQGESPIYEVLDQPETQAVSKGLEMAYRLKGSYAPEKKEEVQKVITGDIKDWAKAKELKEKYEKELLETIENE